jgi:hypothetical protein
MAPTIDASIWLTGWPASAMNQRARLCGPPPVGVELGEARIQHDALALTLQDGEVGGIVHGADGDALVQIVHPLGELMVDEMPAASPLAGHHHLVRLLVAREPSADQHVGEEVRVRVEGIVVSPDRKAVSGPDIGTDHLDLLATQRRRTTRDVPELAIVRQQRLGEVAAAIYRAIAYVHVEATLGHHLPKFGLRHPNGALVEQDSLAPNPVLVPAAEIERAALRVAELVESVRSSRHGFLPVGFVVTRALMSSVDVTTELTDRNEGLLDTQLREHSEELVLAVGDKGLLFVRPHHVYGEVHDRGDGPEKLRRFLIGDVVGAAQAYVAPTLDGEHLAREEHPMRRSEHSLLARNVESRTSWTKRGARDYPSDASARSGRFAPAWMATYRPARPDHSQRILRGGPPASRGLPFGHRSPCG